MHFWKVIMAIFQGGLERRIWDNKDNRDTELATAIHSTSDKTVTQGVICKTWERYECKDIELRESLLRELLLFCFFPQGESEKDKGNCASTNRNWGVQKKKDTQKKRKR